MGIISSKSFIICAIRLFVQNWNKTKKKLYCMCEPLLFVNNDNCVNKEYEETNEWDIATRRWGCTFWWSGRIVSHDGLGRPYYPTHGKTTGGWNEHWKKELEIQTNMGIHSMEQLVVITDMKPSWGHFWTPTRNDFFGTKRLLHLIPKP